MEFAFYVLSIGFLLGAAIIFLFIIPPTLYSIPYLFWLGKQHCAGRYTDIKDRGIYGTAANATRLYVSFFIGKRPVLR